MNRIFAYSKLTLAYQILSDLTSSGASTRTELESSYLISDIDKPIRDLRSALLVSN